MFTFSNILKFTFWIFGPLAQAKSGSLIWGWYLKLRKMRLPDFACCAKGPKIQNVNFKILLATKWDQWKLTQCQKMSVFVNSNYLWSNFWHTIQNIFKRKKGVSWSQRGMRRQRQVPKRLIYIRSHVKKEGTKHCIRIRYIQCFFYIWKVLLSMGIHTGQ